MTSLLLQPDPLRIVPPLLHFLQKKTPPRTPGDVHYAAYVCELLFLHPLRCVCVCFFGMYQQA